MFYLLINIIDPVGSVNGGSLQKNKQKAFR